ncbi:unnamed protein product [Caenorhabditis nigoni]
MDSIETVCRAIDAFYSGGPETQLAQKFLQNFQETTESWTICDQIIRLHSNSLACYFASQTLRTKILKKFDQLPPDQYEALRQSLLQHLARHGAVAHDAQSEATTTQLCLAIADLYIQVPTWNNWIFELLAQCQSLEGDRTQMTLTLLQVFPEEAENIRGIGENRRAAIREELAACEQPMISFLSHVLEKFHTNMEVLKKVFKCLESNLQNQAMRTDHFAVSPLISSVFHVIASIDPNIPSTLHETATNCVVAALYRVEDIDAHAKLAEIIHKGVISLVEPFQKAQQMEDMDRLQNIARIFVELIESFYVQIVNDANPDPQAVGSLACFDLLLLVANHHDYSLIEMTFGVWYRVTEELFKYDDDQYIGRFRPYAERFIMCLYDHCKMEPDDTEDVLDDSSEFGEFRTKAIEALRDVVFIVNSDKCIQMMHQKILELCQKPGAGWEESEAALFVMAAVVQNILPESEGHMPDVIRLVTSLPVESPPALIVTALNLLSDLNDWLELHTHLLEPVVQWILRFATDPTFAYHVAVVFDRITCRCAVQLQGLLPQLLSLITALQTTRTNGIRVEEAICNLTRACATIIAELPPAESKLAMEQLCEPIITNLNRTVDATDATHANNNNNNTGGGANKENEGGHRGKTYESWGSLSSRPILWIDRCAFVFKDVWHQPTSSTNRSIPSIQEQCLWLPVAQKLIEALLKAARKFEGTPRIIEHAIRSVRLIFRALGPQSMPFVEEVVTMMIETYPKHRHSSFLYLASVIVDEYGQLDKMRPGLLQMLEVLSHNTFPLLQGMGAVNHPDTVDDLFRLAQRFTMRATTVFFTNVVSQMLFVCAVSNIRLDHMEASRSIIKFIVEVLDQLASAKRVKYTDDGVTAAQLLVNHQAEHIMDSALWMSLFSHSGQVRREMTDLILQIGRHDEEKFKERLAHAVAALPNAPLKATPQQLTEFVENVVKEKERHAVFNHTRDLARLFM